MTHWDPKYSYGWQRAEILGALINGVFLVALCFTIALSAIQRFIQPEPITDPVMVLITGCVGLAGNLLGLLLFHDHGHHHHHHHNHDHHDHEKDPDIQHDGGHLNMKGIFLHVLGDALGNIGVIATALFIWLTPYSWKFYMDPVVSLVIAIIIFFSAVPLVRATSVILLQGVPSTVPLDNVRNDISKMDDVVSVHELHIWQLSDSKLIASMHVRLTNSKNYMQIATQMRQLLHEYGVHSVTIQPEFVDEENEKIDETTALIISSTSSDSGRDAPLTKSTLVDMPEQEPQASHRIVIIEERTHFNHVFAFPRAAIKSGFERDLFVPYDNLFDGDETKGVVVHARAVGLHKNHVDLDREVPGFGKTVTFDYLVYATGTSTPAPGHLGAKTKLEGIEMLKTFQNTIKQAERPIIIGGGAVGIELAAEIKEHYPEKCVTLMHSRTRYMPRYKTTVDKMVYGILRKNGVRQVLGDRACLPKDGYPLEIGPVEVPTRGGQVIKGDLAILCIGMTPNTELLAALAPDAIAENKFAKVKPTLQIYDDRFPHIFAAGDVVDHTDVKTGHFAWSQGRAALTSIVKLIEGGSFDEVEPYVSKDVALIRMILGNKEAIMQSFVQEKLVAVGSWICGRSIPENVYAVAGWNWMKTPLDAEHRDM
ncbi:hypothetical protein DFQ28_007465 [Apophysomyces sp. BC1034]|nr:hypothetical protein DFQ28_007465 [Apophysomyces sp. BC1034]